MANSEHGDIVPPKRWYLCIEVHGFTSQMTAVLTCREKFKHDNFRISAWRHFVALLVTFDYKEKKKIAEELQILRTKTT
jgi:hypothetical protein